MALNGSIFIPIDYTYERIAKSNILFVEAFGSYVKIYTSEKRYHLTTYLQNFIKQLSDDSFVRVSRKYLINLNKVDSIKSNTIHIEGHKILIGRKYREHVIEQFPIIRTK
ncbi:LytTR family DNA-binding domain-containing protein [Fulvivirgaceae bacterium BMA10]|uniref:LytTR family DNA-binding domain-containing protein n=1 Tax=Splendidivirga corallicola TaxID=3051826 RepID=A0ABT8KUM6_9BACT|nr:LytTR family DNA-binding domain-containing protein [Fulvivirgaceae bacterium BMA10]